MKDFGLQIYSVRDKITDAQSMREVFEAVRKMGYTQLQTAGVPVVSYEEYGRMAAEVGLEIVGTHDNFTMMCENFEQVLANHRALNTKNMGVGGYHPQDAMDIAGWEEFIQKANQVAANCAKHGMKFTYHNHSHEFVRLANGKTPMDMLVEGLDPVNTSFVLDTYWVQHGGADVRYWIERLTGRIDILHLKDMQRTTQWREKFGYHFFAEIGSGNMNWPLIFESAKKAGVQYYIVEQDMSLTDSLESVRISAEYLKTLA